MAEVVHSNRSERGARQMESVANTISDSENGPIGWSHSRDEIVEAVEQMFSYLKDRDESEQKILEHVWNLIDKVASLGGEPVEDAAKIGAAAAFAPVAAIGAGYIGQQHPHHKDRHRNGPYHR